MITLFRLSERQGELDFSMSMPTCVVEESGP